MITGPHVKTVVKYEGAKLESGGGRVVGGRERERERERESGK
jgi:hypothetical protein